MMMMMVMVVVVNQPHTRPAVAPLKRSSMLGDDGFLNEYPLPSSLLPVCGLTLWPSVHFISFHFTSILGLAVLFWKRVVQRKVREEEEQEVERCPWHKSIVVFNLNSCSERFFGSSTNPLTLFLFSLLHFFFYASSIHLQISIRNTQIAHQRLDTGGLKVRPETGKTSLISFYNMVDVSVSLHKSTQID